MTDTLYISGIFGEKFSRLYPAIKGRRCIMFSNNPKLKKEAHRKGWEYVFVPKFEISDDYRESSLQSKYIKFLQFLDDFPEFQTYHKITYFDHKNVFSIEELTRLENLFADDKNVFMISCREGQTVRKELEIAMAQERYRMARAETEQWIQEQVDKGRATWVGQACATSFIMYKNFEPLRPFLKEIYETGWQLKQPHCQVIWSVLSQAYNDKIQTIHWTETSMYRRTPLPFFKELKRQIRQTLRKCIQIPLELCGVDYEKFRKDVVLKIIPPGIK